MNAKALVVLAALVLTALAACGTTSTAGRPAPAEPVATSTLPPTTTAPPVEATTSAAPSKYTPAEWAFLAAYPSMNPDAALQGGYAICTSLEAGISQPQIIEYVQGMARIDRESAKQIVFAATTHLCPR